MPSGQGRDREKENTRIPLLMPLFTDTMPVIHRPSSSFRPAYYASTGKRTKTQISHFHKSQRSYRAKIPAHLPPATIDFVSHAV